MTDSVSVEMSSDVFEDFLFLLFQLQRFLDDPDFDPRLIPGVEELPAYISLIQSNWRYTK